MAAYVPRVSPEFVMKAKSAAIALGCGLFLGATAHAQGLFLPWDTMTPLTDEDRAIIVRTVQQKIHGQRPGTVASWSNPASGHSGTITLLNKLTRHYLPCERIEYKTLEPERRQLHSRYVFTSCRLPDGTWKLAE